MQYYDDYRRYIDEMITVPVVKASGRGTLSFTPYISNQCSAACRFCSEKLYNGGIAGAALTLCPDYRERLTDVLLSQRARPIFLSISGMEPTESIGQLALVSEAVQKAESLGCRFSERVMYSNLSGFAKDFERLTDLVRTLQLTRIECSRHHFREETNQEIVRFKPGEPIRRNSELTRIVRELLPIVPVTMVCVMQKNGIASPEDVRAYLEFARGIGVQRVVFRGLSIFSGTADGTAVSSYIHANRVETLDMIRALPADAFHLKSVTQGYYYYSFCYEYRDMQVLFEMSDYDQMHREHHSTQQHKLIFYPNGELYKDWNRDPQGKVACPDPKERLASLAEVARELTADGSCAVIGSFGAWLTVPQVLDHVPHDLDLFLRNDPDAIRRAVRLLQDRGFSVFSWQDRIHEDVSMELLRGRYYIRGIRDALTVDLTYEIRSIGYDAMVPHCIRVNGIGTYTPQGLMKLLEVCERDDLRERLGRMRDALL